MSDAELSISLPLEIEREILELTARMYPGRAPTLVRISTYVSQWIIPILYEMVIAYPGNKVPSAASIQKYGHHVRNLLIGQYPIAFGTNPTNFLLPCPNVTNLAIWTCQKLNEFEVDTLKQLPLTRLSIDFDTLFRFSDPLPPQAERLFPSLTQLTHLDIVSSIHPIALPEILRYVPRLTYLSLAEDWEGTQSMPSLLAACPHLKFTIYVREARDNDEYSGCNEEGTSPGHIIATCDVPSYVDDWRRGARGESDVWECVSLWTASIWKKGQAV